MFQFVAVFVTLISHRVL